jgi:hypothetical protein
MCSVASCNLGFDNCDGQVNTGCETNLNVDLMNCGSCANKCSTNNIAMPTCTSGVCGGNCDSGFKSCDGTLTNGCETNINTDPNNCGNCGMGFVCSINNIATRTCIGGVCNGTCAMGFDDCDHDKLSNGCETDLNNDQNNCGACGTICPSGVCVGGVCQPSCSDHVQDGSETDVDCGGGTCIARCGDLKKCMVAGDCQSGVCTPGSPSTCAVPACNDGVQNGTETDVDCGGSCTTKCATGKKCAGDGDCASGTCDLGDLSTGTCA